MRTRPGIQAGFTLIELMIVLILIGIFSGLMLGEMRGTYEDALLRSTARKIISAANLASSQAVTLNESRSLAIDPEAGRLSIQRESAPGELIEEDKLDSRIKVEIREWLPEEEGEEGVAANKAPPLTSREQIWFYPDGTADRREILVRDRMGVELWLRINPITGRIRILEKEAAK